MEEHYYDTKELIKQGWCNAQEREKKEKLKQREELQKRYEIAYNKLKNDYILRTTADKIMNSEGKVYEQNFNIELRNYSICIDYSGCIPSDLIVIKYGHRYIKTKWVSDGCPNFEYHLKVCIIELMADI